MNWKKILMRNLYAVLLGLFVALALSGALTVSVIGR